jgi:hypothetical protein
MEPDPYEENVIGEAEVPELFTFRVPVKTSPRRNNTWSPAFKETLLTLDKVRHAAFSLVPELLSFPEELT